MGNVRRFSTTASGNSTIAGGVNTINFAEGQAPSTVNNSLREFAAQIRGIYKPDEWGWVECSATASVASQTVFKLTGNQTADYTANRRTRLKSGSTTRYGTIVSSSFTTETTVTITVDSGSLSASHTLAAVAAIDSNHIPANTYVTSNSLSAVLASYLTSGSASTAYAALVAANVFTANQTIRSTDAGATVGPDLVLDRNSATPAASDLLGRLLIQGRDSGGNSTDYAAFGALISDTTNGSEDAWAWIATMVAGTYANRFYVANGIFTPNATGGDQGADTINAKAIYDDGVLLTPGGSTLLGTITTTSGTEQSLTSLVLTSYTFLLLIWRGVSTGGSVSFLIGNSSSDDVVVTQATGGAGGVISGETKIQLSTGKAQTFAAISDTAGTAVGLTSATTAITTASTVVYVNGGGGTFDAGSIDVYGIK